VPATGGAPASGAAIGPTGPGAPPFADGLIYVGLAGALAAVDAATGNRPVAFSAPAAAFVGVPAIAPSGVLVVASSTNIVYAFDFAISGAALWTYANFARIGAALTLCGGSVFYGDAAGAVTALDLESGAVVWNRSVAAGAIVAAPALDAACATVYVGAADARFYALDAATGAQRWFFPTVAPITASAAVSADGTHVYVGLTQVVDLYAFGAATGLPEWQILAAGAGNASTPALAADNATVYVGTASRLFAATAAGVAWSAALDGAVTAQPTVAADGAVLVGTATGTLYALAPADGAVRWSVRTGGPVVSAPAIAADGRVFLPLRANASLLVLAAASASATPSASPSPSATPSASPSPTASPSRAPPSPPRAGPSAAAIGGIAAGALGGAAALAAGAWHLAARAAGAAAAPRAPTEATSLLASGDGGAGLA